MTTSTYEIGTAVTLGGKVVDLKNPQPGMFDILDIASGLSKICRYAGQVADFYSVAEHSFFLSMVVGDDPATELAALIDDGSETYLGENPAPVLDLPELAPLRLLHRRVTAAIRVGFGLPVVCPSVVEKMDVAIRLNEMHLLRGRRLESGEKLLPIKLACWDPKIAERMFLERFYSLQKQLTQENN